MALFKILRGSKENLITTKIKDGYAYFTPSDGRFYIDVSEVDGIDPIIGDSTSKGANRICINSGAFLDELVLDCGIAAGWEEGTIEEITTIYFDYGNSSNEDETNMVYYDNGDSSDIEVDSNIIIYDNGNSFII